MKGEGELGVLSTGFFKRELSLPELCDSKLIPCYEAVKLLKLLLTVMESVFLTVIYQFIIQHKECKRSYLQASLNERYLPDQQANVKVSLPCR